MKTDSLFYQIFLNFPVTFFDLLGLPSSETENYQFTSREVKQLSFRLDGLFYPNISSEDKPFYLVEVQFQPEPDLYYRIFAELFLFLRQYKPVCPWAVVVIYPSRSIERKIPLQFDDFLALNRVTIIYLDELEADSQSLGIQLLQIILAKEELVVNQAKSLVNQARIELTEETIQKNFIDLVEQILVYKLPTKTREEIEAMFGLEDLKKTRFYQDVKAEGIAEGISQGIAQGISQGIAEGESRGRTQEALNLVLRQIKRKFPQISTETETKIRELSLEQLENLGEALLDFQSEDDLVNWLN
jgi:predicted transposase/invertase (TIGR01784 family)